MDPQDAVRSSDDSTFPPRIELAAGERIIAGPISAVFTRVAPDGAASEPTAGQLYVTNVNLINAGEVERRIKLSRITELGLAIGRILMTVSRSQGLVVEVENPSEVRAVIADAVAGSRPRRGSELVPVMASGLGAVADPELVEDVADVPAHRSG
jgi:hypothetical protein